MWYTAGKDFDISRWCGVCGLIKGVRPSQRLQSTEFLHGFVARFFFFPSVFVLLGLFVSGDSLGGLSRVVSLG